MDLAQRLIDENRKFINAVNDLKSLCAVIINSSIHWTGEDEEKCPELKEIRTLAGIYLDVYKNIGKEVI